MQVIDVVIHKYEQGSHGAEVFQEYEKGLQALLRAYKASSPGEHFQIAEQDSSQLEMVCRTHVLCCAVLCCAGLGWAGMLYAAAHGRDPIPTCFASRFRRPLDAPALSLNSWALL